MKNIFKNSKSNNRLKVLALLVVLGIVTAVALFAYDNNEYDNYGHIYQYNYTYAWDEGYDSYISYYYDENNYMYTPPPPSYSGEYGYHYYNVENNYYDYYYNYAGYGYNYGYEEGGYIGYAPEYIDAGDGYDGSIEYEYTGPIYIEVNDEGIVTLYPPRDDHGVMLDGDYLRVYLPRLYYLGDISVTLPYGWTYSLGHHTETIESYIGYEHDVLGEQLTPAPMTATEPRRYTVITFRHDWNDGESFIGIMPMAVTGLPTGWSQATLPVNATPAQWNTALTGNANHVISVPAGHTMTSGVTIPAGRHIIIASSGTNLGGDVGGPLAGHTLSGTPSEIRINSNTRHFNFDLLAGGGTLTLSHITLDGRNGAGAMPPANTSRGGVDVVSAPTPSHLNMLTGSTIQNSRRAMGGAVHVYDSSSFTMIDGLIHNNASITGNGGGVHISTNSTFTMSGGAIRNNTAAAHSGGVHVTLGSTFTMYSGTIGDTNPSLGNIGPTSTGGVYIHSSSFFTMHSGYIINNSSLSGSAGGLRVSNSIATMNGGTISGNNSGGHGGGIFVWNSVFTMHGGTVGGTDVNDANVATGGAGGVYVGGDATTSFTMENGPGGTYGRIIGNRTDGNGGGVMVLGTTTTFTMSGDALIENNRAANGGGFYVWMDSDFYMHGGTIRNNRYTAAGGVIAQGGGVRVHGDNTNFTMTGGTIGHPTDATQANRAARGGGVWVGGSTFNMQDYNATTPGTGTIVGNLATLGPDIGGPYNIQTITGGGVWVGDGGNFNLHRGNIVNNQATSVPLHTGSSNRGGGGVYVGGSGTIFTMTNGVISGNSTSHWGGGVHVRRSAIFNMEGGSISNNETLRVLAGAADGGTAGGGIWASAASIVNMSGGEIYNNRSEASGGGIAVASTLNMTGGIIRNNRTNRGGGGVHVRGGGVFNMDDGYIRDNRYTVAGGVIPVGGGVSVYGVWNLVPSTFNMTGGTIGHATDNAQGNHALRGGGVWVGNGATFTMQDYIPSGGGTPTLGTGLIINNEATSTTTAEGGGGVFATGSDTTFTMMAGTIELNRAHLGGGAMLVTNAEGNLGGSGIIRSHTQNPAGGNIHEGGGVWLSSNASFEILANSTAQIYGNHAFRSGAGIFLTSGADLIMHSGQIRNNQTLATTQTDSGGGGVYLVGTDTTFVMHGGEIHNNVNGDAIFPGNNILPNVTSRGSGVHVASQARFDMYGGAIRHNSTRGMGAVNISDDGEFYMHGGNIHDNWARSGAGVYMEGSAAQVGTFVMNGGYIQDNWAIGRYDASGNFAGNGVGGGVRPLRHAHFTMNGGVIRNNRAASYGGGVCLDHTGVPFVMNNGQIYGNVTTYGAGGGVGVGGDIFTMHGGSIHGNEANTYGGGMFVSNGGYFYMTGGTIGGARPAGLPEGAPNPYANTAVNGGGVWVGGGASFNMNPGSVTVNGVTTDTYGTIIGNTATYPGTTGGGGGGVRVLGNSTFNMTAGYIIENTTPAAGGGVLMGEGTGSGGTFTMSPGVDSNGEPTHGVIADNAALFGGGVHLSHNGILNMTTGVISDNAATQDGGGVHVHAGTSNFIMGGNAVIEGNTAENQGGGVRVNPWGPFTMNNGTIRDNNADQGGGVFAGNSATVIMHNGIISGNTAVYDGGGLCLVNGVQFTMHNGFIFDNTAPSGGGIFISGTGGLGNSTFNMNGGTIGGPRDQYDSEGNPINNANSAVDGGGVWVGNGAIFNLHGNDAKHITGNNADYGGGVWVESATAANRGQMRMQPLSSNLHITHNTAVYYGGGIFTQNHEYASPLNMALIPAPYSNLTILAGTTFTGNSAAFSALPPSNATATGIPNIIPNSTAFAHPLNNYDINFRSPPVTFSFIKTTDNGITPLPGAVFRLYRRVGNTWVHQSSQSPATSSPITGQIEFELERLVQYKMVEYSAPAPFQQTIPGYWLLEWRLNTTNEDVLRVHTRGGNPSIISRNSNRYIPNRLYPPWNFDFTKTDNPYAPNQGEELESAIFNLYRWDDNTNDWATAHFATSTSNAAGEVSFALPGNPAIEIPEWAIPGTQFKLRETAPEGFIQPPGHWIITPTFNYAMQRVDFEVTRILASSESPASPFTPNFQNITIAGASVSMLESSAELEEYIPGEEITPIAPTSGGYVGIAPASPVTTWAQLRQQIMLGGTQTILIDANFATTSGTPVNANAIQLPTGANITLTSTDGNTFTIVQTHNTTVINQYRHFIVPANTTLTLNNITLRGNQEDIAHSHGGIFVSGANARLYMNEGSTIADNRRFSSTNPNPNGRGGGVFVGTDGTFTMNGGSILNNRANGEGGGVVVTNASASFNLINGHIAYNESATRGGGIFVNNGNTLLMSGGIVERNTAGVEGGGIHVGTSGGPVTFTMSNGIIRYNRSEGIGGGIAIDRNCVATITDGQIYGNTAGTYGGGISFTHVLVDLINPLTHLTITGGYITNNHATYDGGGIYTTYALYNNPLDYTTVGGVYTRMTIGPGVTFFGNTARQWFYPPTIINAPTSTAANQLPNIVWNSASGSSVNSNGYLYLLNNYDINFVGQTGSWYLGNQEKFRFSKTNSITNPHQGLGLLGAWFQLYWRPDTNSAWQTRGPLVSSNTQGLVQLPLTQTTGEYRLVETVAPSGFQAPFGYWLIDTSRVNTRLVVNGISEHDGNPQFVRHPATTGNWYVGNRTEFVLPLTGGDGMSVLLGSAFIVVASVIGFAVVAKKKIKFKAERL